MVLPQGQAVGRGENITLSCVGQGGPNNSYAWEKKGEALCGENENQLTLMIVNGSSGGLYRCAVSNAAEVALPPLHSIYHLTLSLH